MKRENTNHVCCLDIPSYSSRKKRRQVSTRSEPIRQQKISLPSTSSDKGRDLCTCQWCQQTGVSCDRSSNARMRTHKQNMRIAPNCEAGQSELARLIFSVGVRTIWKIRGVRNVECGTRKYIGYACTLSTLISIFFRCSTCSPSLHSYCR